jgi:hypothetical protein
MEHEFTVGEIEFKQKSLKLKAALRIESLITAALVPALLGLAPLADAKNKQSLDPRALREALAGLDRLPELVESFAQVCQVKWQGDKWVSLSDFADLVFERKAATVLAWLVSCIEWQFADFFDGTGLPLVMGAVNRFASQLGLTGGSGG